jgi:hypothetical protein
LISHRRYAPDTDLDKVRDRVVEILVGLFITAVAFKYIWPSTPLIESRIQSTDKLLFF